MYFGLVTHIFDFLVQHSEKVLLAGRNFSEIVANVHLQQKWQSSKKIDDLLEMTYWLCNNDKFFARNSDMEISLFGCSGDPCSSDNVSSSIRSLSLFISFSFSLEMCPSSSSASASGSALTKGKIIKQVIYQYHWFVVHAMPVSIRFVSPDDFKIKHFFFSHRRIELFTNSDFIVHMFFFYFRFALDFSLDICVKRIGIECC